MILRKLKVENIATYDKAEIDFKELEYPVFVSGKTGAGKTTLLVDAITAALFAKAYDSEAQGVWKELIMSGKSYGKVELEFETPNGKIYKIERIFRQSGQKRFLKEIINGKEHLKCYGDDVEKEIKRLLGLDYKGLLNSVIVRQGDVFKFVEMRPSDRRKFLVKILGIGLDRYRELASKKLKNVEGKITELEKEKEMLRESVKEEETLRRKLKELRDEKPKIEKRLASLKRQRSEIEKELGEKREKLGELKNQIEEINRKERQIAQLRSQLDDVKRRMDEIVRKISKYSVEKIRVIDDYIDKKYRYDKLVGDIRIYEDNINTLRDLMMKKKELEQIVEKIRSLTDIESKLMEKQEEKDKLERERGGITSKIKEAKDALQKLRVGMARCPICGARLTDEKILERKRHLEMEIVNLNNDLNRIREKITVLKKEIERLRKEARKKQVLMGRKQSLEKILEGKEVSENIIREKQHVLENLRKEKMKIEFEILKYTNTSDIKEAEKILREIKELAHEIPKLEKYEEKKNVLEEQLRSLEKEIAQKENIKWAISELEAKIKKLEFQKNQIISTINNLEKRRGEVTKEIEEVCEKLRKIDEDKRRISEIERELEELEIDKRAYEVLIKNVFSEGGLPAKLLEKYLMVIQKDANEYLRIFGQNFTISLDLIRQRGTQSIRVEVYDANGYKRETRTYSGGEQTLIGFAIRLAISRMISHIYSVKHKPRFLVIDEGFGHIDMEKRDAVAKALTGLYESEEFEQIIVISHQEDLKDNPVFKTLIEVSKDEHNMSRIKIYE